MHAYDQIGNRTSASKNFVYDGWAMIQETSGAEKNSYVYGVDLSGSNAFYYYDANGNVTELIGVDGVSVAHYEYDPYGNTTVKTGPLADINPFRFYTKYIDDSTGLIYYGHRYYSTNLSRWLSRDPIKRSTR